MAAHRDPQGGAVTLTLIDFGAVYGVAWESQHADEGPGAAQIRAVGIVRIILQRLDLRAPDVVLCGDSPRNWRHDMHASYKANREAKPPGYLEQLRAAWAKLTRELRGVAVSGFEADDVIATLAGDRGDVQIVTHDKDLLQLVDDARRVRVVSLRDLLGGTVREYDESGVRAKLGVPPGQVGDYLALVGDKSDNVPGVPGIGPKHAAARLAAHGTLDAVLEHAATSGEESAVARALREHAETARLSRRLVELRRDVPVPSAATKTKETETVKQEQEEPSMDEPTHQEPEPQPAPEVHGAAIVRVDDSGAPPTRPTEWAHSLEPTSPKQAFQMAQVLHDSGLFRSTFSSQSAVFAAMCLARAHGVETMKVLMPGMVHNIKGKLAMSAQMIVGLVLRSMKADYFECVESTAERAVYVTKRAGGKHEQRAEWTLERAKSAGYVSRDSLWSRDPATMLRHRAATELARMAYPDVVAGLYDPSEFETGIGGGAA
jgi:5'-3' exonuclease